MEVDPMKTLNVVLKVLTALATVAGAIYIVATYGEQIVAWARKALASLPKCPCCEKAETVEDPAPAAEEPAVPTVEVTEEAPAAEETPAAEEAPAEEPAPEVVVAANEPVAEDTDFAE